MAKEYNENHRGDPYKDIVTSANSDEEPSNVTGVIYTKDKYHILLKDLNKLVDKFIECEPIDDCYLDLDFLDRKGMLKLCYFEKCL